MPGRRQPVEPRHGLPDTLVMFNREAMARYTDGIAHGFLIVCHLHDEATMRLRSQLSAAPAVEHGPAAASASRRVPVALPVEQYPEQRRDVAPELHGRAGPGAPRVAALVANKDAETLATALRRVIDTVANAIAASTHWRVARVLHCMVGNCVDLHIHK